MLTTPSASLRVEKFPARRRGGGLFDISSLSLTSHTLTFPFILATECYCGNSISGGSTAPSSDCDMACSGNSSQMCGGTWRINVYSMVSSPTTTTTTTTKTTITTTTVTTSTTTSSPTQTSSYSNLGCFVDSSSRVLSSSSTTFPSTNSPSVCAAYCKSYAYFGVEYCSYKSIRVSFLTRT